MTTVILLGSVLLPMVLVLLVLLFWRFLRQRDKRRSPLTFKVLNLPGEGLRRSIEKHDDAFHEYTAAAAVVGP
ncbi:MAG: hypothetical protein H0T88_09000, partial [Lysobacter sp.]|nr:hypothetical protein [Lysobacter sp.]